MSEAIDLGATVEERQNLGVVFSTADKVNFSSAQNGVSILRRITLHNGTNALLENLAISIESSPSVIKLKTWTLDRLGPGEERNLSDLETPLNDTLLSGLNEAEFGQLTLKVSANDTELFREERRIEMLARDEWGGIGDMAHLVAAYVSPNDAVIAAILKEAGRLLERGGQSGAIDGYQSKDPGRAWMLAGAIWSATAALGLTYAYPPASFETRGQKVRSPARIKSEGLATCLDSALLLAACFEAAGLNPVVLFSEGHAWTGVWLTERDFGQVTEPDVMTVRKAIDAREFVTMETTLLTKRPTIGFEQAVSAGRDLTAERNEHTFQMAVDIRRARVARIRPLASHSTETTQVSEQIEAAPPALPKPLAFDFLPGDLVDEEPKTPQDRISRWQRKLLDLSLRNRLLNFRDTKQTIPFICPDVSSLEDQLADGKKFKALALKDEDPVGQRDLLTKDEPKLLEEVARDAFSKRQLAVPLRGKDTNNRLLALFRKAKSDMQEGGTNTLFLAAGFLRWKKAETDTRSYRAPLLLIPVKISRRSAQSDFIIEHHEDDVRLNATLLEFLKRDFDLHIPELEGELPRDDSGYDLPLIFEIMRRKVRDVAGFEVVEELAMSTFSFAKFLMWKDLVDRTDSLRNNTLVQHLVDNPTEPFLAEGAATLPSAVDVDRRVAPRDLFTPLPADSSQLSAVLAAQEGHDFVLIGPPGTGKSQTIANIISQCLAVGKTVLFVAEKSAALDVVHRRLSAHGLGDAVLELHSNKADRKSVLDQLRRSWDRQGEVSEAEWIRVTDDLSVTRTQLNEYVAALHLKGTQGFSVYEAVGCAARAEVPFSLSFDNKDAHDAESYAHLSNLAEAVGRCHQIVQGRPGLPLVGAGEWSFSWQAELLKRAENLRTVSRDLAKGAAALSALCGLTDDVLTRDRLEKLVALAGWPANGSDVSWGLDADLSKAEQESERLGPLLNAYRDTAGALSASYPLDRLGAMPLDQMDADWRRAQTKFWPFSIFAKSAVRKLLQTYATDGKADPATDIAGLDALQRINDDIDTIALSGCPAFDKAATDAARLTQFIAEARQFRAVTEPLAQQVSDHSRWTKAKAALARRETGDLRAALDRFRVLYQSWATQADAFQDTAGTDPTQHSLDDLAQLLDQTLENREALEDWTRWMNVRNQACAAGLTSLVEAVEARTLTGPAEEAFTTAYAQWWLPQAMDAEPVLRGFSHWSHEDAITKFCALDDRATEMAAEQVLHRIRHGLPARDGVARKSELGTLRHQLGLQRPSMPIRTLISEMPATFTKLAPCVLMSPLSVAQYLPAGQAAFDVVIFDEASQITTWDAIGAIARGRQAIIVGDPKQLPPTNFFGRTEDTEEDLPESEKDLASILDEVAAAGIPTQQLDWHYRSRDESLIAFSNWHYYGGRLVTFPSPTTESQAVQLHQVNGTYARGLGRTNEDEARAITRMVVRRLTEWLALPEEERLTLGVITFNGEQQGLILDLLDEERRKNPDLEWFFEDDREEPVIVKNLENIQGDERDVMLFSITFGPDHAGKLSMAFGALNGDGGEKRLNVAITRARQELHIFASIRADQIDLTRTKALGVKHLKGFLDFAARGPVALPSQDDGSLGPVENVFEAAIKAAIEAKGWELRPQIGVSGFRIDLGVVHPDHAGVYLAGIECDGATYHGSATARDRDKVRQAVLENLGWKILRIWSTDWFKNPKAVVERIHEALTEHLEADRERRAEEDAARISSSEEVLAANDFQPDDQGFAADKATSTAEMELLPAPGMREPEYRKEPLVEGVIAPEHDESDVAAITQSDGLIPDPEQFYEATYIPRLERLIEDIVRTEGPLPVTLLSRRVAQQHGWQRTGRRIVEQVGAALARIDIHDEDGVDFAWSQGGHSNRVPFQADPPRSIRDISRSEIAWLYDVHAEALDESDDPARDISRLAGINRLTADSRSYLETCIEWRRETALMTD
ncbi:DUF3320 domain-containing protein [Leisingera sp. HS039]|uniref:DUF3320 domain-containing protein n=1 Tax=unclassified Leisingera TaxID=2614906 RepID=UPI001070BC45|nr:MULTISPECIES: DUF3320 domain-containing protein [unclassified Leisingera]MBQ4826907.1 DUF3320 domain-containing protein [Leisingera sp. HS039]QBR37114.1 DUF3320 domain-containing protein [Leisingera sp. NJS201]